MSPIQSKLLLPYTDIVHGFSTKADGNMSYKRDIDQRAESNNTVFLFKLGINKKACQIINPELRHGNTVALVEPVPHRSGYTEVDKYSPEVIRVINGTLEFTDVKDAQRGIDACFSNRRECFITMRPADCAIIFVYDPITTVYGLIHIGTAGLFSGLIQRSVDALRLWFSVNPRDLICFVGPSISAQAYDLKSSGIYKRVLHNYLTEQEARCFDPQARLLELLKNADITAEHIDQSVECTASKNSRFYSNHRCKTDTERAAEGRMLAIIGKR